MRPQSKLLPICTRKVGFIRYPIRLPAVSSIQARKKHLVKNPVQRAMICRPETYGIFSHRPAAKCGHRTPRFSLRRGVQIADGTLRRPLSLAFSGSRDRCCLLSMCCYLAWDSDSGLTALLCSLSLVRQIEECMVPKDFRGMPLLL